MEVKIKEEQSQEPPVWDFLKESGLYERWMRVKQRILLRREERKKKWKTEEENKLIKKVKF